MYTSLKALTNTHNWRLAAITFSSALVIALPTLIDASSSQQVEQLTNPLVVPRTGHAATVLSDGRVFLTGGRDSAGNIVAVSEIFDPSTETSTGSAALSTPRVNHTSTLLTDGRVLVAGGDNGSGPVNSAEIFDPANAAAGFRTIAATMGAARSQHTATLLSNGTVLIAGGDAAGTAEIFDPTTETFSSALLSLATPRTGHTTTLFSGDNVLLAGGGTNSMEMFTSADKKFTIDPKQMSAARTGHFALELSDTRLLLFGGDTGNTIDDFNLSTDTLTLNGSLDAAASSATLLANGNILVIRPDAVGLYSPDASAFTALDETLVPGITALQRSGQTATQLSGDKKILVAGGKDAQNLFMGAAIFNPVRIWSDKDDYQPGDDVILSGSGWKPNENVYLYAVDDTTQAWTYGSTVTADASGGFVVDPYFVVQLVQLGANFKVTSVGAQSAMQAEVKFTDSALSSVSVGGQTGTATFGTAASPTYTVTVGFNANPSGPTTVQLSIAFTGGTPTGVTTNFPISLTQTTGGGNQTPTLTINTSTNTPAGTYNFTVTGTVTAGNPNVGATRNGGGTLVVGKAGATVTLNSASLSPTYDGNPHAATATTNPPGLTVNFTYNGSSTAPTNAGSYAVVATINDNNYSGSTTGTLVIGKAAPTVTVSFTPSTVTYDGNAHPATATATGVGGLNLASGGHGTLTITYTPGGASAPVNASATPYTASAHFTSSDNNYTDGDSPNPPASLTINKATPAFSALTVLPNPIDCGTPSVTVTGQLHTGSGPTMVAPVGQTVTITLDGAFAANVPVGNNAAGTFSAPVNTSALSGGPHSIGFSCGGNTNFNVPSNNNTTIQLTVNSCNQKPVAKCKNVTVSAGASCTAAASIDDGSSDPDTGDTITLSQSPAGPYQLGDTSVTLTVTDSHGATDSCTATVTVKDTTPPVINGCPTADITVNTGPGRTTCDQVATWTAPTATDNCSAVTLSSNYSPGATFPVGTTPVTYTAVDGAGNQAIQCSFNVTVVDNTPPTVTPKDAMVDLDASGNASISADDVVASELDNCAIASTDVSPNTFTCANLGDNTVTITVTDVHGNITAKTATVTVVDNMKPVITQCAANQTIDAACAPAPNLVPDFTAGVIATDNCGNVTVTQSPAAGTQVPVGDTKVTLTADDGHGNTTSCEAHLFVLYKFTGFFQPVDNTTNPAMPVYNRVKAGSAIPVKFSLSCNQGLNIMWAGFPGSGVTTCVAGAPTDDVEATVTAGGSSLNYDAVANQYIYVWKTDTKWAGTCRVLNVKLADGTNHYAYFTFFK